jgi:inorganic triphosphatase YgiF
MTQPKPQVKFDIADADIAKLEEQLLLSRAESLEHRRLRSVYFDTDDDEIWKAGAVLRIRHEGGRIVQTIKGCGPAGAAMQRDAVSQDIGDDLPVLAAAGDTGIDRLLAKQRIASRLTPRFEIAVERRFWTMRRDSAEIEVMLDRGKIVASAATSELCELVLRLRSGDARWLYQAARQLGAKVALHLDLVSKGERGYRLVRGIAERPERARPVHLMPGMPTGAALQEIGAECLRQFVLNERLLHDAGEAEPVHQARIAIRRLRAALAFFKPVASDGKFPVIDQELKWMSDLLGEGRDLDVLQSDVIEKAYAEDPAVGLDELAAEVEARRRAVYARLTAALGSTRFRELLVDLVEWLEVGDWCSVSDDLAGNRRDETIEVFAARELERRTRKLLKSAADLEKLDDQARHRVRIAAKKLRYMAEFFVHLFAKRDLRDATFLRCLEDLQTFLGELNDRLVASRFLAHLAVEIPRRKRLGKDAAMLFAAGRIGRALELADKSKPMRRAAKTAQELADSTPFWH